jgi:tRNA (guanine-N7-)-methyltransferase
MDWSKHYPQFFHHQQQNQNTKYVEFADIGCGYGGLLGKMKKLRHSLSFLSINFE